MISKNTYIDIDAAAAGMVLAASVSDHQGNLLLPAGSVLSETMLTSLRRRAIAAVPVCDDKVTAQDLEAERARLSADLDLLFRAAGSSAAAAALRQGVSSYRMEALQ